MEVKSLRNLALGIFKTLNHLNSEYMKEIFHKTTNLIHSPLDIKVKNLDNTTNMVIKALEAQDFISAIPCQSRLKKKMIKFKMIKFNKFKN